MSYSSSFPLCQLAKSEIQSVLLAAPTKNQVQTAPLKKQCTSTHYRLWIICIYIFSIYIIPQSKTAKLVCCCWGVGMTQEFPAKLSTLPWLTSEQLLHLPHFFAAPFSEVAKSRRYGIVMIPIQKCVGWDAAALVECRIENMLLLWPCIQLYWIVGYQWGKCTIVSWK